MLIVILVLHLQSILKKWLEKYRVDTLAMIWDNWKKYDFSDYDSVYYVAGIVLVPSCTILLKLLRFATGVVDKGFGNLAYDQKMSIYKEEYSLKESINKTEE